MPCDHDLLRSLAVDGECPVCPKSVPALPVSAILARAQDARIEMSRRRLSHFVRNAWHVLEGAKPLEWSWHIECIADHVQWTLEQWMGRNTYDCSDLIINVPPGSMKSLILNVFANAWMWIPENEPSWQLLAMSGSEEIVKRDARKVRRLIKSSWYLENFNIKWEVSADEDALTKFSTTAGGIRRSQTTNSAVTGQRYDAIFNDDPNDVKDISEVKLAQVIASWDAAGNRLNDLRKATRVIIQQRTHEKDLSGYLLARRHDKMHHLCIPMEYTEAKCACGVLECDTPLGVKDPRTTPGEVLHEERNTPDVITAEKTRLGSMGTAGQLNQRPAPEGGAMFKLADWRHYDELPRDRPGNLQTGQGVLSIDCTFGKGKPGAPLRDRCAMVVVFPQGKATRFVDYAYAERMGIKATIAKIKEIYELYTDPRTGGPMIGKILIEKAANGEAVCEMLEDELPGIKLIVANTDKMSRANACLPTVEAGNVRLRKNAPWDEPFTAELAAFPTGAHDDFVDAFTQAITEMAIGVSGNLANACVM